MFRSPTRVNAVQQPGNDGAFDVPCLGRLQYPPAELRALVESWGPCLLWSQPFVGEHLGS